MDNSNNDNCTASATPFSDVWNMKAVFITYGQSLTVTIEELLTKLGIRGFTRWEETHGRGSEAGEPHYGTHAWPSKNGSLIAVMPEEKVEPLLCDLRRINEQADEQGLTAFVWNVEGRL